MAPTLGLALIAKDEASQLPRLLESIAGAFDQVVLVDTGSTDSTLEVFHEWAAGQEGLRIAVDEIAWADDFAAARQHADSLLSTDWACWADCDDVLKGAEHLRAVIERAHPQQVAFICDYHYAHDEHHNVTCTLRRERLVRRGAGTWVGRVHEAQLFPEGGVTSLLDPDVCVWVHQKNPDSTASSERNLRILQAWEGEEPENARVLAYLGTEHAAQQRWDDAISYFERYLALHTGWDEERAQVHRKYAMCLIAMNRAQDALETSLAAIAVIPDWPDNQLSLGEAFYAMGEYEKAIKCALEVLRLGMPQSLLILYPLDYTFKPRLLLAAAHGALGRIDEAVRYGREALAIMPSHEELASHLNQWQAAQQREHVADSWIAAANILVQHDEQLKALALLEETVPHFARDHPRVVAIRSQVRERLLWVSDPDLYASHYETGGSKPEDGVPDERVTELCDHLPRAAFLKRGIDEQLQEAA